MVMEKLRVEGISPPLFSTPIPSRRALSTDGLSMDGRHCFRLVMNPPPMKPTPEWSKLFAVELVDRDSPGRPAPMKELKVLFLRE